jgi:hypothetical protein
MVNALGYEYWVLVMKTLASALFALSFASSSYAATITIDVAEDAGGNVVFTGSGTVDLDGLTLAIADAVGTPSGESNANFFGGLADPAFFGPPPLVDVYLSSVGSFSPLTTAVLTDMGVSGDAFGIGDLFGDVVLSLDADFVDDDPISFVWVAESTTIADLGVNFGDIASIGNNTVTVKRGTIIDSGPGDTTPVPLPASALMFAVAFAGLGVLRSKGA